MYRVIYDELIRAIIRILTKLDLSIAFAAESTDEAVRTFDDPTAMKPNNPADYQFFLNLVDFIGELLTSSQLPLFSHWVSYFGRHVILLSHDNPHVSGFLKLLTTCMVVCRRLRYFEVGARMETEEVASSHSEAFVLFKKFLSELLLRLSQLKGEMLAASLHLILSFPIQIVEEEFSSIIPAIRTAFEVGLSHLPLANAALDTLEEWLTALPSHLSLARVPEILPALNDYLTTSADTGAEAASNERALIVSLSGSKRIKKMSTKKLRTVETKSEVRDLTSELSKIRHRIVLLLGSLGGQTNSYLIPRGPNPSLLSWDTESHLKYNVPFHDVKPVIHFDPFLPRVIELALHSSDRQSKVCACELLHAITVYTIGYSSTLPDSVKKRSPHRKIYARLFHTMLRLGCDVEEVCVQLFRPLTLQTIHWFTGNKTFESPDTISLLSAILEGLEDPSNSALRDFSALCVKEFLAWSIKQTSKKQQEQSPTNAKSLLKRLYSMCQHPIPFRRLGAALAFNRLYTVFREESSLVDTFTIEILVNYLGSLKYSHRDAEALGVQDEIRKVISHLERIIKFKRNLFNQENRDRRTPKGLKVATIQCIVSYAMSNIGATETAFREVCMHLFYELSPLISGFKSPQDWMAATSEKGIGYFTTRFERGGADLRGILKNPILKGSQFSLGSVEVWFESLIAALDCYSWIVRKKLLTPTQLFTGKTEPTSMLFESIGFFCTSIALNDIAASTECFDSTVTTCFTPKETELFNTLKSQVVVKLLQLITALLQLPEHISAIPKGLWSEALMKVILVSILNPTKLGFSSGNLSLIDKLPKYTEEICQALRENLKSEARDKLFETLTVLLSTPEYSLADNILPSDESSISAMTILIQGYTQLYNTGLYSKEHTQLPSKIIDTVMSLVVTPDSDVMLVSLSPQQIALAGTLMQFATKLGVDKKEFLSRILSLDAVKRKGKTGEVVYSLFARHINQFILTDCRSHLSLVLDSAESAPDLVMLCLNSLLDYAILERFDHRIDAQISSQLVPSFLDLWPCFKVWYAPTASQDSKTSFLLIFNKFTKLLSANIFNEHSTAKALVDTFSQLILDSNTLPTFRYQCLSLVPFFLAACMGKSELRSKLKSALSDYTQANFPVHSTELPMGSTVREEYIASVDRMLVALRSNADTIVMLEVLLPVLCREEKHIYRQAILRGCEEFIEKASPLIAKSVLNLYYSVYADEMSYSDTMRKVSACCYAIPMLAYASDEAFIGFYTEHIVSIMQTVEAKLCRQSDPFYESQLVSKLCAFEFVEKLYARLPSNELSGMDSKLNRVYCKDSPKNGKELTQAATKSAHAAKCEDHRGEPFNATRLEYHQCAYKLLCSIITCTQTKMSFYSTFLFKEDLNKCSILWENFINTEEELVFPVQLDSRMEQIMKQTPIRSNVKSEAPASSDQTPPLSPPATVKYISSQYLSQTSSLSTDISQFDFTMSPSFFSMKKRMRYRHVPKQQGNMYTVSEVKLELDSLNRNPCMHSILQVLDFMEHNKINPDPPPNPSSPSDLPQWMAYLHSKLTDSKTHLNIRLFIARVVVNRPMAFQPYAQVWVEPLVQLLLLQCSEDKGMTYFIVDLAVTVLSWSQTYVFSDEYLACKLLEGLVSNSHSEERTVLRNNLSIIRMMVELWKSSLTMPYSVIFRYFSHKDVNGKMQRTGVQLFGIVLANQLPSYGDIAVSEGKYYESFLACLDHRLKEVYAPTAEITGMLFNSVKKSGKFDLELLMKWAEERMSGIISAQNQPGKFVECLHKIHINFPEFCDRFTNRILFLLPTLKDETRNLVVDILTSRAENIPDLKTELKTKDFYSLLRIKDYKTQISVLKLALKVLPSMDISEVTQLTESLDSMYAHTSPESREVCYDLLMSLFDRKAEFENTVVMARVKRLLLRGLLDDSEANRLKVFAYWNDESRLPSETLQRLFQILTLLYSEGTEDQFLSYSTNFFLELVSRTPDYPLQIFPHPLSECKFESQKLLDYSYSHRQSGFLPLFANTLPSLMASQSQGEAVKPEPMDTDSPGSGELRSTIQPIEFTPTQEMGSETGRKYNWLAPSLHSQPLFNPGTLETDQSTESSLLFTGFKLPKRMKRIGSSVSSTLSTESVSHPVMQLKRRFLKSQEMQTVFFQKQNLRKKRLREDYLKYQKVSRGNKVVMYRQYRTGDLPDIQIKNSELIRPLQALAQRDDKIARLLFSTLFKSIFGDISKYLSEHEVDMTKKEVQDIINGILKTTQRYSSPFIASIMDISLKHDCSLHFYLDPTLVSSCCLISYQQLVGIMVLENQLIQKGGGENEAPRGSKRARGAMQEPTEETSIWIELGRLYKSIEDFDTLRGIFGNQLGTQEVTRRAVEAEESNDYLAACQVYKRALDTCEEMEPRPTQEEQDLWEESLMSCLENLGKWRDLEETVLNCISDGEDTGRDLMQVWSEDYYIERHLPRLIKTKVKLLISGREDPMFDKFIATSFTDELRRSILETHFSEQLALYYLVKNNVDRAKHYVNRSVQRFAQVWSGLPDFQPFSKASKLQTLQTLVEMDEFINFVSDRENFLNTDNLDRLLNRWHNRLPNKRMDPLSVWSDVITNRSFYLETILCKFESSANADLLESRLTNEVLSLYLSIAEAASAQSNFSLATHFIKQVRASEQDSSVSLKVSCSHVWAETCLRRERGQLLPSAEDVSRLVSSLYHLQEVKGEYSTALGADLVQSSQHHRIEGCQSSRIADLLLQPEGTHLIGSLPSESLQCLRDYLKHQGLGPASETNQTAKKLYLRALSAYKSAVTDGTNQFKATGEKESECMVKSLLAMAK